MGNSSSTLNVLYSLTVEINDISVSNNIINYKPSSRYPITLEQARDRALRAIKKRKED